MSGLGAERAVWQVLTDAGVEVYRMGTEDAVTWVEVWIDGHVLRVESEWQTDSIAWTVATALLVQINTRRPGPRGTSRLRH
jgi:hypothetical protein